jgi:tetratricopeptide (TPR) repeat protein
MAIANDMTAAKTGRNDPCSCGSGRKFKHCHGALPAVAVAAAVRSPVTPQEIGALVALIEREGLAEAEEEALALLALHPSTGIVWKILSVALVRQGKEALRALRRTAELLPLDAEALRNLGALLHDRGEWAEALETLQRSLAIEPDNADAHLDAGDALRGLGRPSEAVPHYERALALNPQLVEAHNNLGNTLLELGRHDAAIDCYRRAHGLRPHDAQILCNLGNAQRLCGRREEAAASYRQALELDPGAVQALNDLGDVLRELGERRAAVPLYRRAIELDPTHAARHCSLGNVLFELREVEAALESYRTALTLDPSHAPGRLGLAFVLRQLRRPAEAEASCRAALAIDPNYVDALAFLGELCADRGQFAEAEKLFQRAIELKPDFPFAFASIAGHRKMTAQDGRWLAGAKALLTKPLPLGHEISLRYALGKYFDDVQDYDAAFEQYRQANELTKRYGSRYDRAKLGERLDAIMRSFEAHGTRALAHGSCSELPVFIIGMPRSGTSLAEQILASHPAVFGAGEVTFWSAAYNRYREAEIAGRDTGGLLATLASEYLEKLTALAGGATRVVDKLPANFMYAGMIHAALPRARIIHMRRHALDTCLSIYFQNFFNIGVFANDLSDLAHYYAEYLRITEHWRARLPATALLEVPYEQLIADQQTWTRRMLDFVGLPWDPRCLDFHRTDRVVITASRWQVRQQLSTSSAGRWRNYEKHIGPLRHLEGT